MAKIKRNQRLKKDLIVKTRIEMADIVLEGILGLVPGGALPYKIAKKSFDYRRKTRLNEFHEQLLHGIPVHQHDKIKEMVKENFRLDDYYSFLNYVVTDEEETKTPLYGRIFQGVLLRILPQRTKIHILKASRELTTDDFELMRSLYIHSKYEFVGSTSTDSQINELLQTKDTFRYVVIQRLIRLGFLSAEKSPRPTELLRLLVELTFDLKDLVPESIGRKSQTIASARPVVCVVWDTDEKEDILLIQRLEEILHRHDIQSFNVNPYKPLPSVFIRPEILVLCAGKKGVPIENTKKYIGTDGKMIVEVLFPGAEGSKLPYTAVPIIDLTGDRRDDEINRFIDIVNEEVKKRGLRRPLK